MKAAAIWYVDDILPAIRSCEIGDPGPDDVLIEALASGVSRGTESLVFQGKIPESEARKMRAPNQEGDFPYPVKYGYSMVGRVLKGPADLIDKRVFCLHPHQTRFLLPRDKLTSVDDALPTSRAVLAANMETALNAVWDGAAAPGERIAVIGAGVVGCLTAYLAGRIPGTGVTLVDVNADRRTVAETLGVDFAHPGDLAGDHDLVFHASATASGLQTALDCCGFEARVVEMSWYGSDTVTVSLGGGFHSKRLRILSSQVGSVASARRARWTFRRRLYATLSLLNDDRLDSLLDEAVDFEQAPPLLAKWLGPNGRGLCHRIDYT